MDILREHALGASSFSKRTRQYPTEDVRYSGGTLFWSRAVVMTTNGEGHCRVPRLCHHCGETTFIAASVTLYAIDNRSFTGCCDACKHVSRMLKKLLAYQARGEVELWSGAVILYATTIIKHKRQNIFYVDVRCRCKRTRTVKLRQLLERPDAGGLCYSCAAIARMPKGDEHPYYKPEGFVDKNGYRVIGIGPDDPMFIMARGKKDTGAWGQIFEHRYVMANHLGRPLEPWEHVHHIGPDPANPDKSDNRIENLEIQSVKEHSAITKLQAEVRKLRAQLAALSVTM